MVGLSIERGVGREYAKHCCVQEQGGASPEVISLNVRFIFHGRKMQSGWTSERHLF
jgi:hypothetical protein